MTHPTHTLKRLAVLTILAALMALVASSAMADEALDAAFEALDTYRFGDDRAALKPIDDAIAATHGDADARAKLEERLAAVLATDAPHAAKDYACRKLSLIGTADSVPALAKLLTDEQLSHMGRYALERIPGEESLTAMRTAMGEIEGELKIGMINSLGVRRDEAATGELTTLLDGDNPQIAAAAAAALGSIGTPQAAAALKSFLADAPDELQLAAADAYLACAEQMLADGNKLQAMMIYKTLSQGDRPKHIRVAAMRGLLAAAKK